MRSSNFLIAAMIATSVGWVCPAAMAGDLRVPLPKSSITTPVQQLNREGVKALSKQQFAKAKALFYKAYLFDPNDPFTLNNLGYIAELEGQVERAHRFYTLASQFASDAVIDRATSDQMVGKPMADAVSDRGFSPMKINSANVEAIRLLSAGRTAEADSLLQNALAMDPHNVFTLNNMGVLKEAEGEYEEAIRYYDSVAASHSNEPVVVTMSGGWRGKPISKMASESARRLKDRLKSQADVQDRVARLNLRGVSALNRNDRSGARQYFQQAYELDPQNAFSINNLGYVAEMDGDSETAQFYYEKARKAERANARVGLATRRSAEGMKLSELADGNDQDVESRISQQQEIRSRQTGPIELKRRPTDVVPQSLPPNAPNESPTLGPPQPQIPQLAPAPQTSPLPPPQANEPPR